jgi:hypothetical protein
MIFLCPSKNQAKSTFMSSAVTSRLPHQLSRSHHGIIAHSEIFPLSVHNSKTHIPMPIATSTTSSLLQSQASKGWQNEASLVDLSVVVPAELVLLLGGPATQWLANITLGIRRANHEANLTGWVGRDSGVCVFNGWEDLLAVLLELGDQWKVEPLVLGWRDRLARSLQ